MATEHMVSQGGVVIFNPTAGRGQGGKLRAQAQAMLGDAWEWRMSQKPGHAEELAREAAQTHSVVTAFGGDGTVGDVARGILGTEATLGIIPVGTGNDCARNLGLKLDLTEAVATVLNGVAKRIDMGSINGTPFINNAGLGFDEQVMRTMNTSIKFVRGQPAFLLAILKLLPGFKAFQMTYSTDGGEEIKQKAMMLSVLNGKMYGGGMLAAPLAEMEDGRLDVMIIKEMPKPSLLALLPKVVAGNHQKHPAVQMFRTRNLKVQSIPPQPLNIDGDVKGLTPATIESLPAAIKVLVR